MISSLSRRPTYLAIPWNKARKLQYMQRSENNRQHGIYKINPVTTSTDKALQGMLIQPCDSPSWLELHNPFHPLSIRKV